jgi:hypothetical protein
MFSFDGFGRYLIAIADRHTPAEEKKSGQVCLAVINRARSRDFQGIGKPHESPTTACHGVTFQATPWHDFSSHAMELLL